MIYVTVSLSGLCWLSAIANACGLQADKDAALLIRGVLSARQEISSGRFRFEFITYDSKGLPFRGHTAESSYDVVFRPDAIRATRFATDPNIHEERLPPEMKGQVGDYNDPAVADRLRELGVLVDEESIDIALFLDDRAYRYLKDDVLRVFDPAPLHKRFFYVDPWIVGIALEQEDWQPGGLRAILGDDVPYTDVTPADTPQGVRVVQREKQRGAYHGVDRIWIDTSKDFSVIRREVRSTVRHVKRVKVIKTTLQQLPNGYWYPARVERSVEKNGELERSSTIKVTHAEINTDIDEQEFTVAAMGVPAGTSVYDNRTQGAVGHWTGSKIVMDDVSGTPVADLVGRVPGGWTRWLWGFAGIAAVAAALAFWRRRRAGAMT